MGIQGPTVHAFAKTVFESAIRIRSVPLLDLLLERGLELESLLESIASIGDSGFTKHVLMRVNPIRLKGDVGGKLFHRFVSDNLFDSAQFLLDNGVSVDCRIDFNQTALFVAAGGDSTERIKFLLEAGADPVAYCSQSYSGDTSETNYPLTRAVFRKKAAFVTMMLACDPDLSLAIEGKPMLQWASLHYKRACDLLVKHMEPGLPGVLLGELLDSAVLGGHLLATYIQKQAPGVSQHQLEQALEESIRGNHYTAATTLLQYGVDPNGFTLETRPVRTTLQLQRWHFADLLLRHEADLTEPGLLTLTVRSGQRSLLEKFLLCQEDPGERMKALVAASSYYGENIVLADTLLRSGVDIDTPGLSLNPLQSAALSGYTNMVSFLIHRGANVNATACPDGGRTALQAALESDGPIEVAKLLLHHGADISTPPALLNGVTALEAYCHNSFWLMNRSVIEGFCGELLDAGAQVNRPNGEPSSVLHGIINQGWHKILARCLDPQYNTIADHMWCNEQLSRDEPDEARPFTPTQLAASNGDMTH